MRKACILLLAAVLLCCVGCGSAKKTVVTPPSRTGEETYLVKCPIGFRSMEEAYCAADVVAHVRVGNWLGDTKDYPFGDLTCFETSAVKLYKGTLPEPFVLVQEGSSKRTREGYPLFTYGDELLVFLSPFGPFENADDMPCRENSYGDIGAPFTHMDVAYDREGNAYFLARELMFADRTDIPNYRNVDPELCDALLEELASRDPLCREMGFRYQKIFAEADLEQLFAGIDGE